MYLNYNELIETLLERFPEIEDVYKQEKDWVEDLPHLVFGTIFNPYFLRLLKSENTNKIVEAFKFLEDMANSSDTKVQEILVVTILEYILPERLVIEKVYNIMGSKTSKIFREMEIAYGWT